MIAINGLGVAPTGATPEFYREQGTRVSARVRPARGGHAGHAGRAHADARRVRHALACARCSRPRSSSPTAIRSTPRRRTTSSAGRTTLREWPYSKTVMLPHAGEAREAPQPGEIFRQADLAATLRKLVEAERQALAAGKSRKEAIAAALRALLPRRHRGGVRARLAASRAASSRPRTSRSWKPWIEEPLSHQLPRHRRLQARRLDAGARAAAGAQHPRELRPARDGLQQRATTSTPSTRR